MQSTKKTVIGRLESIALPELGIVELQVKVDTGAKTSSLHVDNIVKYMDKGTLSVKFDIHPDIHNVTRLISCKAVISDIRKIKSSNGVTEQRYVIKTPMCLGDATWPIEITLTDRAEMNYLMLFGREAIGERLLVDASKVFLTKLKTDN